MMPDDAACWPSQGEIDIMEMINGDGTLHSTYHWQTDGHCGDIPTRHPSVSATVSNITDFGSAYHEYSRFFIFYACGHCARGLAVNLAFPCMLLRYAVEYSPTHIAYALDGRVFKNMTKRTPATVRTS